MPLHPALRKLLDAKLAHPTPPQWTQPLDHIRTAFHDLWTPAVTGPAVELPRVVDTDIDTGPGAIPIRIYMPGSDALRPVILYFHGGGYVKGDLESCDAFCRRFAKSTDCLVVSVEYRLAPESRFPAALDDAYAATVWASRHAGEFHGDTFRLVVSGESAGGNLAAVVAIRARDTGGPRLSCQILLQPVLDFTLSCPSIALSKDACLVPREDLEWYYRTYSGEEKDRADPLVSPLFAESLRDLPPAIIVSAEYDTLRDEAEAYAQRLREGGCIVHYVCRAGMIHGFLQMAGLVEEAQQTIDEISVALRRLLRRTSADNVTG